MAEIKNRFTNEVIASGEGGVRGLAEQSKANLREADLREADLRGADLREADLWRANLRGADLREANLRGANLWGADLREADLWRAKIEFALYPSIRLLSSISLGVLPEDLTVELMRRDCAAHPHPERFDEWANGGQCPYQNEERFWLFSESKELWQPGEPQMKDRDLILEICRAKSWKIKGHLE